MMGWLALFGCYVFGAIPFGLMVGKITRGIDIRDFGSGNIGASNVLRTLGPGPALLVFVLDTAKGWGPVVLCKELGLGEYWVVAGALLSVLGHTFSVFLRFKGGKGVATSLGVIIGLNPVIAAIALGIWFMVLGISRYISVASILAAISVPVQMVFWRKMNVPVAYQILAGIAALAILAKHIPNIKRLVGGDEPRIGESVDLTKEGGEGGE